jgi:hypothetical protein
VHSELFYYVCYECNCLTHTFYIKQELQEGLKFPIEIFWNLEASLKSELLYFFGLWNIDKQRNRVHIKQLRRSLVKFA